MSHTSPLLEANNLAVHYEGIIAALSDVTLRVERGEVVALLGANGSGKSTTLRAISGLLAAERGAITAGEVRYGGKKRNDSSPRERVLEGLVQVIEGRRVFTQLTVLENLESGSLGIHGLSPVFPRKQLRDGIEEIFSLFPRLQAKRAAKAGLLSGGEQQMLAIGRALIAKPKLLLLDEPSMGLAPIIVREIFEIIASLRSSGVSVLLAEQNARLALRYSDRAYVLESGRIVSEGSSHDLSSRSDVQEFYLGLNHGDRRGDTPTIDDLERKSA